MSEQKKNSYEDDDMRQLLDEIEELEEGKVSIRMMAAADCGSISRKIKTAKARAKELLIPSAILNGLLKTRKLERQLARIAEDVPDDLTEMWVDASGQFAWLPPAHEDEPEATPVKAAKRRRKQAEEADKQEQAEGDAVLKDLVH